MTDSNWVDYATPAWVYESLERMAPAQWLRVAVRIRKVGSKNSWVLGTVECAIVDTPDGLSVEYVGFASDPDDINFSDWVEDEIDVEDWVEGVVSIDRDGDRSTYLKTDPAGPTDDFLELDGPSWEETYIDAHRDELRALAT